nr:hypothetical protein [Tanacetum cinerariifolium]
RDGEARGRVDGNGAQRAARADAQRHGARGSGAVAGCTVANISQRRRRNSDALRAEAARAGGVGYGVGTGCAGAQIDDTRRSINYQAHSRGERAARGA